jgi:FkbM family methyltransferase
MIEKFIETLKLQKYDFDREIVILDIGSRDCLQAIEFTNYFKNSKIFAFECNPNTIPICKKNIESYPNIILIDKAVNSYDGTCKFYPINQQKTITTWKDGNPGASSLFKANGNYKPEKYVQDEIDVSCCKIETILHDYGIDKVDLVWMDLQGAEMIALKSLGIYIDSIDYIHTEVTHFEMYTGQNMFTDIHTFLLDNKYNSVNQILKNSWQEDVIYKRTSV